MTTAETAGRLIGVAPGILDKERTIAAAGFNRWLVPPAALCIHLCIGMAYGFSVFWLPLSRAIGLTAPKACPDITLAQELFTTTCDWKVASMGWMYTLFFVVLGVSAALWGGWLERAGPRKAGVVAALCWAGGLMLGAIAIYVHQLWQYPHPVAQQAAIGGVMDIALDDRGVDTHLAPLHHPPGLGDLYDPVVHFLYHRRSECDPPPAHGLGIGHLLGADACEVAVHQIGTDFTLQNRVTPIAHVLEDQQAQHHLGGKARPAMAAAVGMAMRQSLVDCRDDRIVLQHNIGVLHPALL